MAGKLDVVVGIIGGGSMGGSIARGLVESGELDASRVLVADSEAQKREAFSELGMRVFEDAAGKMNVNPTDAGAEILVVSQFTLYADVKSRRPGFTRAARHDMAVPRYERVTAECRRRGFKVETGVFGADMQVRSQNDGPVTILIDTAEL